MTMTTSTGLVPQLQEDKVDRHSTITEINRPRMDATPPATRTGNYDCSVCAGFRPSPCAAAETGSNLPAELVMITRQPPPFVLNGPLQGPQYRMDAPPPLPRRCSCDHSVCTRFCPSCATVEIGPNSPAELAIVFQQPPPVVQQRMDASPPAPRRCSCDHSVCTGFCPSCATVETGPNSPAELAIVSQQPPPVVQQRMDASPPAPRRCSCDHSVCTGFCPSCATVETGPNSPAELAIVSQQSPPVVQQRMDASPPAPRRCSCDCLVCTRFCRSCMSFRPRMSACHTPTVEESTGRNHTTSCQLHPPWTTAPVQESLSGYEGPSALV